MRVDGHTGLGLFIEGHLLIGMCEIQCGELHTARQHREQLLRFGEEVLVHLQGYINCDLVITTNSEFSILFRYRNYGCCPLAVLYLFQNAISTSLSSSCSTAFRVANGMGRDRWNTGVTPSHKAKCALAPDNVLRPFWNTT